MRIACHQGRNLVLPLFVRLVTELIVLLVIALLIVFAGGTVLVMKNAPPIVAEETRRIFVVLALLVAVLPIVVQPVSNVSLELVVLTHKLLMELVVPLLKFVVLLVALMAIV